MYVLGWAQPGAGSGPRQGRQRADCPVKPKGPPSRQGWEVAAGSWEDGIAGPRCGCRCRASCVTRAGLSCSVTTSLLQATHPATLC